jgi:thiosulfate/3-mercaptopyruvate sulfurtransferase
VNRRAFITRIALFVACVVCLPATALGAEPMPWIIDAERASKLVKDGATLLDARSKWSYAKGHLEGAVNIQWDAFTPSPKADRGELIINDRELATLLVQHGVQSGRPVVVVDDPKGGWGEAGRIVWMLRTLGHDQAAWVDGGHAALKNAGHATTLMPVKAKKSEGFRVKRNNAYSSKIGEVQSALSSSDARFVDTREAREFKGKTPYGESRGGHLPGARHVWFKELLDDAGYLKPAREIRAILKKHGIEPDQKVVAYCTGGVRSGWFTGVLRHVGYDKATNYAGSMWEWSSKPAADYPLE